MSLILEEYPHQQSACQTVYFSTMESDRLIGTAALCPTEYLIYSGNTVLGLYMHPRNHNSRNRKIHTILCISSPKHSLKFVPKHILKRKLFNATLLPNKQIKNNIVKDFMKKVSI